MFVREMRPEGRGGSSCRSAPRIRGGDVSLTRHFVQYHNTEKMGEDCAELKRFEILTDKSVDGLLGDTVWLIAGTGRDPRRYSLCQVFVVDEVGRDSAGRFKFYARGRTGTPFNPPLPVDQEPWFPEFRESVQRFRFGLRELPSQFLPRFQELAERFRNQRSHR